MSKINIGGQAVIEGVMMRAPRSIAIAVRRPTGEIVVKKDEVVPLSERYPIVKLPFVRGAVALFQSLIVGITALNFSANEAMVEEEGTEEKTEVSYELLKWSAKNDHSRLVRMVIAPGLALQRLTTREPDDSQIEVAIRSMEEALAVNAGYKDDRLVI